MKLLQKHFGGVVKMVKELKGCVEALDKKVERQENKKIKEILDAQSVIDNI